MILELVDSVNDTDGRTEISSFLILDSEPNTELNENPLNTDSCAANVLVKKSYTNLFISIAPGENYMMNLLQLIFFCEGLSHLHSLPAGKLFFKLRGRLILMRKLMINLMKK